MTSTRSRHTRTLLALAAGGGLTLHYALGSALARATAAAEDHHATSPAPREAARFTQL